MDYVKYVQEFKFLPGSLSALKKLAELPYPIVIITNQAGIGRGLMTEDTLAEIHAVMLQKVNTSGGRIDAIYYCPHHPNDRCTCRKPQPGMLLHAAHDLQLDLSRSFMIGDTEKDLQAAHAAGCYPVFVQTGLGPKNIGLLQYKYQICSELNEVAEWLNKRLPKVSEQL